MKLKKSKAGRVLIILYYLAAGIALLNLSWLIMVKVGILISLAADFLLVTIYASLGGELEYREHRKILRKKYHGIWQKRISSEEQNKVIVCRTIQT